jgi:hypothetical protein
MEIEEIRKHVVRHPFRSFIIHLDNGKTYLITHPEIIITEKVVVAVDKDGDAVYLAPEAISAITYYKERAAAKRTRAKRTRTKKTL